MSGADVVLTCLCIGLVTGLLVVLLVRCVHRDRRWPRYGLQGRQPDRTDALADLSREAYEGPWWPRPKQAGDLGDPVAHLDPDSASDEKRQGMSDA